MSYNLQKDRLSMCSTKPLTGWMRNGYCDTDSNDRGTHVVCAQVTDNFLKFTKSRGNDLTTPRDNFPGLKDGDRWCLCALRWREAYDAGVAPPVLLESTNRQALKYVPFEKLYEKRLK